MKYFISYTLDLIDGTSYKTKSYSKIIDLDILSEEDNENHGIYILGTDKMSDYSVSGMLKAVKESNENIDNVHHIHIWSMDGVNNYMTAHIHLNKILNEEEIIKTKNDVKNKLKEDKINHITLEVEYFNEKCDSSNCKN